MALVTAAELRNALRLGADPDPEVARMAIFRAESYLASELGCRFGASTVTETFRIGVGVTFQRLPAPLLDVAIVEVDGAELVEVDQWERIRIGVVCPDGFGQDIATTATQCDLTITYTAGYAPVPAELRNWGIHLAAMAYARGPMPGAKSMALDGVSESFDSLISLPESILRPLRARYGSRRKTGTVQL